MFSCVKQNKHLKSNGKNNIEKIHIANTSIFQNLNNDGGKLVNFIKSVNIVGIDLF